MATASQIIGFAQAQLGFKRDAIGIAGLEEAQLLEILNQAVIEYYERHREGGGEPPTMFQKETGFELTADTATAEPVTSATTDFDVDDSSNFLTSGVLAIVDNGADYVTYTGNAANNFTGVTGIDFNHPTDSIVSRLYALPSDFNDFRSTDCSPFGVTVENLNYVHTSGIPYGNKFYMYDNGTTRYLHFTQGINGSCAVRYNGKPTSVTSAASTVDIPEKDQWFAVWRIIQTAAPILGKIDQYNIAINRAQEIMNRALLTRNIGKRPKVRPMRRGIYTVPRSFYAD